MMKKSLIIGGAVVGAALLVGRAALKCGGLNWESMIERMPDDAPPKRMLRDLTVIRENTDRILERLESQPAPARGGQGENRNG
jgi:hypothetical protein